MQHGQHIADLQTSIVCVFKAFISSLVVFLIHTIFVIENTTDDFMAECHRQGRKSASSDILLVVVFTHSFSGSQRDKVMSSVVLLTFEIEMYGLIDISLLVGFILNCLHHHQISTNQVIILLSSRVYYLP